MNQQEQLRRENHHRERLAETVTNLLAIKDWSVQELAKRIDPARPEAMRQKLMRLKDADKGTPVTYTLVELLAEAFGEGEPSGYLVALTRLLQSLRGIEEVDLVLSMENAAVAALGTSWRAAFDVPEAQKILLGLGVLTEPELKFLSQIIVGLVHTRTCDKPTGWEDFNPIPWEERVKEQRSQRRSKRGKETTITT
jgi:hypothetical protein